MRWVVDDGPLGLLARFFDPGWLWRPDTLEIMDSVAASAPQDKSGRRQQLLALQASARPAIAVRSLLVGSEAANVVLNYLRQDTRSATRDLGEDESIAYCMVEAKDAVFVTMDKRAAFVALAELGPGRVATPFDLWGWLAEERMLNATVRTALFEASHGADRGLPGVPRRVSLSG